MNRKARNGMIGRLRLAVAVLVAAMALPGLAVADHTTCTPGSTTDPCNAFNPNLVAGAQVALTDTPSSISYLMTQADHDQPVLGVSYLVPRGWQFAVNTLRPAQISEGPNIGDPAAQCSEVFIGEENDADDDSARLGRAENLAGGVGGSAWIENTRPASVTFGRNRLGPSEGIRNQNPALAFLGYNTTTQTASMCMYLYANTDDVSRFDDCFGLIVVGCTEAHEEAREHIIPVTLRKVQPGELLSGEDISLNFGWKIDFDLTSFYATQFLFEEGISMRDLLFYIDALTAGFWHIDETTGERAWLEFSKTPKAAGNYEFRGIYATCAQGLDGTTAPGTEAAEAFSVADLCVNGALTSVSRSVFQEIRHPPSAIVYDWGKLSGPAPLAATPRFALVRGTNQVPFSWTQPTMAPGERVKGYLLTIARPGDQDSRHFRRIITDPTETGFDATVCGADGLAGTCNITVNFPLSTLGVDYLAKNGKYDVALVTMYEAGAYMDRRSDGLCDDGTELGAICPINDPGFRIETHKSFDMNRVPGISTWQLMLREKSWPIAYVETMNVARTGGGPTFPAPKLVLLVDFSLRQGEVVLWNALGFEERFFAPSNLIIGDNAVGGLVSFQSSSMTGHTDNWRFDGRILPVGGGPLVNGIGPTLLAFGTFVRYNLKGLPGAIPPGGLPTANIMTFTSNTPL